MASKFLLIQLLFICFISFTVEANSILIKEKIYSTKTKQSFPLEDLNENQSTTVSPVVFDILQKTSNIEPVTNFKVERPIAWNLTTTASYRKCALLKSPYLSDLKLKSKDGSVLFAHKQLLSISSPTFDFMINENDSTNKSLILETGLDSDILNVLLR